MQACELKVLMRDCSDATTNCVANGFVADSARDELLFIRHLFLKLINLDSSRV